MSLLADTGGAPGSLRRRVDVPVPTAYAVFDCETTGTAPGEDEVVSIAIVRLDPHGIEVARFTRLVRPQRSIPADATALHGISDETVASAERFGSLASELLELLDGAVFVAHNARFDLEMLQHAFGSVGIAYSPVGVACTLDAFRLLEPLAADHRLESVCERHGIVLEGAHDALCDVLATACLLRLLLEDAVAPETVQFEHEAFLRLRSRGDTRPATERQIRRIFGLARSAGLLLSSGGVDRDQVIALVQQVAGTGKVDSLTREQVQDVYDAIDRLIEAQPNKRAA
jgi:DNA polymerase III epsilon subunit family exonuclease